MIPDRKDLFINIFSPACAEDYNLARKAMTGLGLYVYEENAKTDGKPDEFVQDIKWTQTKNTNYLDNLSLNKEKSVDIGKALKKFTNVNAIKVVKALQEESPLTFSQLLERTDLQRNILNHTLQDMKNEDLVILKDKNYYLTNYTVVLLDGLQNIMQVLEGMAGKKLFLARINKPSRGDHDDSKPAILNSHVK